MIRQALLNICPEFSNDPNDPCFVQNAQAPWRFFDVEYLNNGPWRFNFVNNPWDQNLSPTYPNYFNTDVYYRIGAYDPVHCKFSQSAVRLGDVNNSHLDIKTTPLDEVFSAACYIGWGATDPDFPSGYAEGIEVDFQQYSPTLLGTTISINTGDCFQIKLKSSSDLSDIGFFQLGFGYDTTKIIVTSVNNQANLPGYNASSYSIDPQGKGEFRTLWSGPNLELVDFNAGDLIIELNACALQSISDFSNVMYLDNAILDNGVFVENIGSKGEVVGTFSISVQIIPPSGRPGDLTNQSFDQLNHKIKVNTISEGNYLIEVYDITGRKYLSKVLHANTRNQNHEIPFTPENETLYVMHILKEGHHVGSLKFQK